MIGESFLVRTASSNAYEPLREHKPERHESHCFEAGDCADRVVFFP